MTEVQDSALAARSLVVSRLIAAPQELVFEAFTDPSHVAQWWGPRGFANTIHEMDVRPGGRWRFTMHAADGTDFPNLIVYTEVARPVRLAYRHSDDTPDGRGFDAVAEFATETGGTRVTLSLIFATAEERDQTVEQAGAADGGNQTLARLEEHLLLRPRPGKVFHLRRHFAASPAAVFQAFTDPGQLAEWWAPPGMEMPVCTIDLRPGGSWHYCWRAPDGSELWGKWVYRDVVPNRLLTIISHFSDAEGGITRAPFVPVWPLETLGTSTFAPSGDGCELTITTVPWNATAAEVEAFETELEGMAQGFGESFSRLDAFLPKA